MVIFDKGVHKYYYDNIELKSVTRYISKFKPYFDKDNHAERVAKREGLSKEFILETWEEESRRAMDYGTHIHKKMEDYIEHGIKDYEEEYSSLYKSFDEQIKTLKKFNKKPKSEVLLHNLEFSIAGTADLLFINNDSFIIGDFKTNKKFNYTNEFGDYFRQPISHLPVCEFNSYALQLSMYAYMYEIMSGLKCSQLIIFYKNNNMWEKINVNYLKSDVYNLLIY